MRITVFGASGQVGRQVVAEAAARAHEVHAVARDRDRLRELPGATRVTAGNASDPADVAELSAGADLVISATRPVDGREADLVAAARALLAGTAKSGARLLLVGGAATLRLPGQGQRTVLDDPDWCAAPYQPIARACAEQLAVCRAATDADWTYLSPPAQLLPGPRTGRYRLGSDELLVDANGASTISQADLAVALLDEAERPRHHRARFTVAY